MESARVPLGLVQQVLDLLEVGHYFRPALLIGVLLLIVPLASLGLVRPLESMLGNLLRGLHPRKGWLGPLSGDVMWVSLVGMGAAWSAMTTFALLQRTWPLAKTGSYPAAEGPLVSAPVFAVFTALGLVTVVAAVIRAKVTPRTGNRIHACVGAAAGIGVAGAIGYVASWPAVMSEPSLRLMPFPVPAVPGSELAERVRALVSDVLIGFGLVDSGLLHNGWIRPEHYHAIVVTGLLSGLLMAGYLLSPERSNRYLPAAVYLFTLITFLNWFLVGLYVRVGPMVPVSLILLLWFLIPAALLTRRGWRYGYFHELRRRGDSERLQPEQLLDALGNGPNLVVIAMSGGGIQAAGWFTWVLGKLSARRRELLDELRIVSAVSGGSVGLAFVLESLQRFGRTNTEETLRQAHRRSVASSLSSVAFGLTYRSTSRFLSLQLLSLLHGPFWDRGRLLERAWQQNADEDAPPLEAPDGGQALEQLTGEIRRGELPLPILNATAMRSGERVLLTPLALDPAADGCSLARFTDDDDVDIPLWTAARLSATFPYVSPASRGYVRAARGSGEKSELKVKHLIDGGYHDNSGLVSLCEVLNRVLPHAPSSLERVAVIEIEAFRSPLATDGSKPWQAALLGPVRGILSARGQTQRERRRATVEALRETWPNLDIKHFCFEPESPREGRLSWHLTSEDKQHLRDAWQQGNELELGSLSAFLSTEDSNREEESA
ncbi:hypothetical protein ABI59_12600 [Acidobacteria bacterium Mor1]|nr:hypothetical protein ABI59_12600 [Acidobacteria bacterium Mor1]